MKTPLRRLLTLSECEHLTGRRVVTWRKDIAQGRVDYVRLGRRAQGTDASAATRGSLRCFTNSTVSGRLCAN